MNNDLDVAPIENARARFLDIIVDHFISSHIIEAPDSEGDYTGQTAQDKLSKRKIREIHYEGDARFVLPLMYVANMYETLVNEVNIRLSSVNVFRGKTIGVALEASGGLYRKIAKKFPRKGIELLFFWSLWLIWISFYEELELFLFMLYTFCLLLIIVHRIWSDTN